MFGKEFFENYIGQIISIDISGNDKSFWITGKVIKVDETFFFFELTEGKRSGTNKTILYESVKEVDL